CVPGHPKVKVFITQGGLQSGEEAMAMGVPLIGIPFFADQDFNVNKIVEKRIGLKIDFSEVTKEIVLESLNKIIYDHSFQENIKKLSVLRNDMPDKPLERAVWWTEYVLRHKESTAPAHCSCGHAVVPAPATRCHCLIRADCDNSSLIAVLLYQEPVSFNTFIYW
ncbi:unnamed protein product, partial [Timema podura]|nr:unnamed protein product [Timema podura]